MLFILHPIHEHIPLARPFATHLFICSPPPNKTFFQLTPSSNRIIPKPSTPIVSISSLPARPLPSTISSPAVVSTPHTRLRASLIFAQEYAILGASLEDRPFVPSCTVVFLSGSGGPNDLSIDPVPAPEGIRSAFRKWEDGIGARAVMVLPLEQVLEAVGAVRGA